MCLPVLTWGIGELHEVGLPVSTCAYLRSRWATCADLDYLCLPVLTWKVGQLHVHSWTIYLCLTCAYLRYLCLHLHTCCIESLPVHTCCTCGMISLSNINAPVLRNDLTTWACTHLKKNTCRNVQKWWCTFDALLMRFWNYIILHFWFSFKGFWCTFDVVSKVHHQCIKSASCFWAFQHVFRKICKTLKNMMHFWCTFETTSFWCTFDVVS